MNILGTTQFLDELNEEADILNLNRYHGDITTIAKVDIENNAYIGDDKEEEVVMGLSEEDGTSACVKLGDHENRLTINTTASENNGEEIGMIEGTDAEEVEGTKVSSSPRNAGHKEETKLNPEQLATWIEKEYEKLIGKNDED